MPVALPTREPQPRTLSWSETVRFFVLLARLRWLDRQLEAANRRNRTAGTERSGDRLWAVAKRWLAMHARISTLLGIPEPPHARAARIAMQPPQPMESKTPLHDAHDAHKSCASQEVGHGSH